MKTVETLFCTSCELHKYVFCVFAAHPYIISVDHHDDDLVLVLSLCSAIINYSLQFIVQLAFGQFSSKEERKR